MTHHRSCVFVLAICICSSSGALSGCVLRPTHPITSPGSQSVVVSRPVPIFVQQATPVVVHRPPQVVIPAPASVSTGVISYPYQRVRYPLHITYTRVVNIYVDGHGLDPTIAIYNSAGGRIGFNDDGGSGLDSQLTLTLTPDIYTVEVAGYGSSTGSFTLTAH